MITASSLPIMGAWLFSDDVFRDSRGAFEVAWEAEAMSAIPLNFKPSNAHHSYNLHLHTLRGMHFQRHPQGQAKLVCCVSGRALDVIVDLRRDSTTFGQWYSRELDAASGQSVYIPAGCAHGFLTLAPNTTVSYLIEGQYAPEAGRVLRWNDEKLKIYWPIEDPILSEKDARAPDWESCDF